MVHRLAFQSLAVIVGVLQFAVVPPFASPHQVGKLLLLAALLLPVAFILLLGRHRLPLTGWLLLPAFLLLPLLLASPAAHAPAEAWQAAVALLPLLLLTFLVFVWVAEDSGAFEVILRALAVSGVVAACLGLFEHLCYSLYGPSQMMLVPWLIPADADARVAGVYGQSNLFALFLLVCLLGLFYLYLHGEKRPLTGGLLRYLPPALLAWCFFLTGSRAGLLALLSVGAVLGWLVFTRCYLHESRKQKVILLLLVASIVVGYLLSKAPPAWLIVPTTTDAVPPVTNAAAVSRLEVGGHTVLGRFVYWTAAFLMFRDHPIAGVGFDNFNLVLPEYLIRAHGALGFVEYEDLLHTDWAHNEVLHLLAEGGMLVGVPVLLILACYMVGFGKFVRRGVRDVDSRRLYIYLLLLIFLVQGSFEWPLHHVGLLIIFSSLVGLLLGLAPVRQVHLTPAIRVLIAGGLMAAAALLIVTADREASLGRFLRLEPDVARPEYLAKLDEVCQNRQNEFRALLRAAPALARQAVAATNTDLVSKVLPYMQRLVELQGTFWQWYELARLERLLSHPEAAQAAAERSVELQPLFEPGWDLLHQINMEKASRVTGKPIEAFISRFAKRKGRANDLILEMIQGVRAQSASGQQNL